MGTPDTGTSLNKIDLAEIPDGFDEKSGRELAMYAIALAFGVDARELWPATASGATKADALMQHLKARQKGPAQIMRQVRHMMDLKFLPRHLQFEFDFIDDDQDKLQTEIKQVRAEMREIYRKQDILPVRSIRYEMLSSGDLSESEFEHMELAEGRLVDGSPIELLFRSEDPQIRLYLGRGGQDMGEEELTKRLEKAEKILVNTNRVNERSRAMRAMYALRWLKEKREKEAAAEFLPTTPPPQTTEAGAIEADEEVSRNGVPTSEDPAEDQATSAPS
jgi:hypothetical protein